MVGMCRGLALTHLAGEKGAMLKPYLDQRCRAIPTTVASGV
jgi:hypothetical protein